MAQQGARPPAVTLHAGWKHLFLIEQIADYQALSAVCRSVRLVVGPWIHTAMPTGLAVAEALARGRGDSGSPMSVEVTGDGGWRDLAEWPPPTRTTGPNLHVDGRLAETAAADGSTRLRSDPADPMPMAGGRSLYPPTSGNRPHRSRKTREDLPVSTGPGLDTDLAVAGEAVAHLALPSNNPTPVVFVRMCDVGGREVSTTVTDSFRRAEFGTTTSFGLAVAPAASRFRAGHGVRLQVGGGAHPLHARNLGGGPRAGASSPPSTYDVHHGADGSRLPQPVVDW